MAVDASVRLEEFGRVVALFVEALGKGQNVPGTEFDTVATSLAPVFDDMDNSFGNLDYF
jgi:hypothetical protein